MLASDVYPPGVPCWIEIAQPDPGSAASFYGGVFGWELEDRTPPDTEGRYVVARLGGQAVAAVKQAAGAGTGEPRPAWTTYVCVEDAARSAARVTAAGGRVVAEPVHIPGVARVAVLADPAGATFGVWEPDGLRGAQLVNAPNTWNFSNLTTPDPDGATAFYGSVFGWEARTAQLGPEAATMLCLPGYGETQDAKEPGFLQRHAESGTPEGFTDAFGWLMPLTDEQVRSGTPASWDVTFAVDDVDAVTDRAVELGGTATVPPFDAGEARLAVLADPSGAPFTVSAYMPSQ